MKRYVTFLLPLALVPAASAGQRFFDDFEGKDLGEHWEFRNPDAEMVYSVHDSLLEVHSVSGFYPREWISASIPEFGDFDMRARVGWTDDVSFHQLIVMLDDGWTYGRTPIAFMEYEHCCERGRGWNWLIAGFRDGPTRWMVAPPGGFHEFRMARTGDEVSAYFDETLILRGTASTIPARFVTLYFEGRTVDLFVDRVSVVPEPLSAFGLAMGMGALALRRRRTR
ncbi:MAG: PEP-CTERM sorting domain-containing protein [Armatimonadota bacterium]